MLMLSGSIKESPQRTHFWNNKKYKIADMANLDTDKIVLCPKCPNAVKSWFLFIPLFHMKIFGGWDKYVVLEPIEKQTEWFVGWSSSTVNGISRIPISGPVRLLVGSRDVWFFGSKENGEQIEIAQIGSGEIGKAGPYAKTPLL